MAMKGILAFSAAILFIHAAYGQTGTAPQKPDEQITVNKEFDEQGNLLRYDSIYSFRWHSDTAITFPEFGVWQDMFSHSPLREYFSDSLLQNLPFFRDFAPHFFDHDSLPGHLPFHADPFINDSSFLRRFFFEFDTTLFSGPDSSFYFPPGFNLPDMKSLNDLLKEFGENQDAAPFSPYFYRPVPPGAGRFPDLEQQKEWDALIERHRREMEELYKKWENRENKKIY